MDPNVFVSAAISEHGPPARILEAAEAGRFELVTSRQLSEELMGVLLRDKFRRYLPYEAVPTFIRRIRKIVPFSDEGPEARLTEDPDDDYLVSLALRERADFLVSGDRHLRDLGRLSFGDHALRILDPRDFLNELERSG